jgi:hypothetical protein
MGTRAKVAALAKVLSIETGWSVHDRVGSQQLLSASVSAPPLGTRASQQAAVPTMSKEEIIAASVADEKQRIEAAEKIQRVHRGNAARRRVTMAREQNAGALRIQRHRRGQLDRRFSEHKRILLERAELDAREARRAALMRAQEDMERQLANMKTMTGNLKSVRRIQGMPCCKHA